MPIPPNPNKPVEEQSLGTFATPVKAVTVVKDLTPDEEGELTDSEADFILTSTLRSKHR